MTQVLRKSASRPDILHEVTTSEGNLVLVGLNQSGVLDHTTLSVIDCQTDNTKEAIKVQEEGSGYKESSINLPKISAKNSQEKVEVN